MYAEIILQTYDAFRAEQQQQQQGCMEVGKSLKRERSKDSTIYTETASKKGGQRFVAPFLLLCGSTWGIFYHCTLPSAFLHLDTLRPACCCTKILHRYWHGLHSSHLVLRHQLRPSDVDRMS